jgi:hypothetical protein
MTEASSSDELQRLAARLTTAHGAGLFSAMAQYLAVLLHADELLVGEAIDELHARTLGVCQNGAVQPNYQFPLAGTPCEALLHSEATPQDASEAPPADDPPQDTESGYFGMALHDEQGKAIGFVCARSSAPLTISDRQHCLIEIVSVLLTAELQLLQTRNQRAALDAQVHRLRAELDAVVRDEVASAATGQHAAPAFGVAGIDLSDTEATGLHHVQREHILRVLNATRWVIEGNSGAALKLGMKPATLRHRMKKLGIARARAAP